MAKRKCEKCRRELKGGDGYFALEFSEKYGKEVVVKVCVDCFKTIKRGKNNGKVNNDSCRNAR